MSEQSPTLVHGSSTVSITTVVRREGLGSLQIGSPEFHQIVEGAYPYQDIPDYHTRLFLQQLQKPARFTEIPMRSTEDYHQGWTHTREVTSSSLSGLQFSHYIASIEAVLMEKIN